MGIITVCHKESYRIDSVNYDLIIKQGYWHLGAGRDIRLRGSTVHQVASKTCAFINWSKPLIILQSPVTLPSNHVDNLSKHSSTFGIALTIDPFYQATCKTFLKGNTQASRNYVFANIRPQVY